MIATKNTPIAFDISEANPPLRHGYVACVRSNTIGLPDINEVKPFSLEDMACLDEICEVLRKHNAMTRFGVSLLHSHFEMADDEVLIEETDVVRRLQVIAVIKKQEIPADAIYMDKRFDTVNPLVEE